MQTPTVSAIQCVPFFGKSFLSWGTCGRQVLGLVCALDVRPKVGHSCPPRDLRSLLRSWMYPWSDRNDAAMQWATIFNNWQLLVLTERARMIELSEQVVRTGKNLYARIALPLWSKMWICFSDSRSQTTGVPKELPPRTAEFLWRKVTGRQAFLVLTCLSKLNFWAGAKDWSR